MQEINNFFINKNQDSYKISLDIKNFIDDYVNKKILSDFTIQYSILLECPATILKFKTKQLIYSHFNFKKAKFIFNTKIIKIFSSLIFQFALLLFIFLFGKKTKKIKKKYDLIIDDIEHKEQAYRFEKLLKKFDKTVIFYKKISLISMLNSFFTGRERPVSKIELKKLNLFIQPHNFQRPNKVFLKGKLFKFIFILKSLLFMSIKHNFNFIYFFNMVLISYIKYNSLFTEHHSKYLIHDRFYKTCPIRNYLFKKNGGLVTACTQTHIPESTISFFVNIDVLFTLGDENNTKLRFEDLGGDIKKIVPVGSHKMEHIWFDSEKNKGDIPDIDLLVIGINPGSWLNTSSEIYKSYYDFIKWIKNFSLQYPNYKIIYKHHRNFRGDLIEEEILRNSNIDVVINSKKSNSYGYLDKSKMAVSFGSTMIIEGIGNNKNCFFIDPNLKNSTFFKDIDYLREIRIKNYKELEDISNKLINKEIIQEKYKKNLICFDSEKVSSRIYSFFKNLKQSSIGIKNLN